MKGMPYDSIDRWKSSSDADDQLIRVVLPCAPVTAKENGLRTPHLRTLFVPSVYLGLEAEFP
jgi:hypothetical protein